MRLLNVHTVKFEVFHSERPRYVTASHRWRAGEEAMLGHILNQEKTDTSGYKKIEGFARYVREHVKGVDWLWVDTCCVNQDSNVEVTEAVNSMFQWYADAELCLAYLADVQDPGNLDEFVKSVWFDRGWTLQELLAPRTVLFVSSDWRVIGHKGDGASSEEHITQELGPCLISRIASRTRISEDVLKDYSQSKALTTEEKLAWATNRQTTRLEDMYYSLLGIFDVRMRLDYGEGRVSARERLLKHISKKSRPPEDLREVIRWLAPPNPWSNHTSARDRYESGTGEWLLQSQEYCDWKQGETRHLGLYGKAGCGKTVLFSTVVEDIREHCRARTEMAYAVFYFTFSDRGKQTYDNLLLSLVAQLADCDAVIAQLSDASRRGAPRREDLETALVSALNTYSEAYLLFDALDEVPEEEGVRQLVLDKLLWLSRKAPSCKILATSRESQHIKLSAEALGAVCITLDPNAVNSDIHLYVSSLLRSHSRLSRLPKSSQAMIEQKMREGSDATFRWAYCQMQSITNLKSTRQSHLERVLKDLPNTLDETYIRMLEAIDGELREDALALLQWIAYSERPMTLVELIEATIVDQSGQGAVKVVDRGGIDDVVDLLQGLVTIIYRNDPYAFPASHIESTQPEEQTHRKPQPYDELRFAHFSVKEFLESSRVLVIGGGLSEFHLESARGHRFLAQSCLTYLIWYTSEQSMVHHASCEEFDMGMSYNNLPLLRYSADTWAYHSYRQSIGSLERELHLLTDQTSMTLWRKARSLDVPTYHQSSLSGLYYASYFGLLEVASALIRRGEDVDGAGGHLGRPLQAASFGGHGRIVQLLLGAGADVNAEGHVWGTALVAASLGGREDIVQILLQQGADVNAQGAGMGNALRAATGSGSLPIILRLLDAGADVGAHSRRLGSALDAASQGGHLEAMRLLLARGANVSLEDEYGRTAIHRAVRHGRTAAFSVLIHFGGVSKKHDAYGRNTLAWKSIGAQESLMEELAWPVDDGLPDVGVLLRQDKLGCSSLHHFAMVWREKGLHGVNMILRAGVSPDLADSQGWTALHWAALAGNTEVMRALIEAGAKSDLPDNRGWTADVLARISGHEYALKALHPFIKDGGSASSQSHALWLGRLCDCCDLVSPRMVQKDDFQLTSLENRCGYAYHCMTCEDYNLCFRCHWDVDNFHPQHDFEQLVRICICSPTETEEDCDAMGECYHSVVINAPGKHDPEFGFVERKKRPRNRDPGLVFVERRKRLRSEDD
ncbi:hypothetical protein LTR78_009691 [Recurvomyces mirabilis]|uniref:NACHT domain-containing protein n=1 Tax=Recurvomyces mirabilis TaxID=574656 RepID=A0AAE0WIE0_9PEZI|nr:hypothetical protein LTR78_009691 [Recurvomyces mirabilis]KAK5150267.1 hypothetical protein LTS14_010243 [Recurvomyces mirabilis]